MSSEPSILWMFDKYIELTHDFTQRGMPEGITVEEFQALGDRLVAHATSMIAPVDPKNSCRLCKCDFKEHPWARIPWTDCGCLCCATPEKRREVEEEILRRKT